MQRRRVLKLVSIGATMGLAGCTGNSDSSSGMDGESEGGMNEGSDGGSMGGNGDSRDPTAGETAYEEVGIDIEFESPTDATVNFELPEPVQCSIAYGTGSDYGTLRADKNMTGPEKTHRVPIRTEAGTTYRARLNLFDNGLNALQTPEFTFTAPESGSATESTTQPLTYIETEEAESEFSTRPDLNVGEQSVDVTYESASPVLGAVQFQQESTSTTRRDLKAKPHTSHDVTINGLKSKTQTTWAVGLIAPDGSMYTTTGMSFETK